MRKKQLPPPSQDILRLEGAVRIHRELCRWRDNIASASGQPVADAWLAEAMLCLDERKVLVHPDPSAVSAEQLAHYLAGDSWTAFMAASAGLQLVRQAGPGMALTLDDPVELRDQVERAASAGLGTLMLACAASIGRSEAHLQSHLIARLRGSSGGRKRGSNSRDVNDARRADVIDRFKRLRPQSKSDHAAYDRVYRDLLDGPDSGHVSKEAIRKWLLKAGALATSRPAIGRQRRSAVDALRDLGIEADDDLRP